MSEKWDPYEISREQGRQEVLQRLRLLLLGKKMVGARKLMETLDTDQTCSDRKDVLLQQLDRDAMAAELGEHHWHEMGGAPFWRDGKMYAPSGCTCGQWSSGDSARDYNGHIIDAILTKG